MCSIDSFLDCRLGRPNDRPYVRSQSFRSMIRRNRSTNSPSWFQDRFFTLYRYGSGAFLLLFFPRESPFANALAAKELLVTSPTHIHTHISAYVHGRAGKSGYMVKEACVLCRMCVGTSVAASIKLRFREVGLIFCLVFYRQFFNLFARPRIRLSLIFPCKLFSQLYLILAKTIAIFSSL